MKSRRFRRYGRSDISKRHKEVLRRIKELYPGHIVYVEYPCKLLVQDTHSIGDLYFDIYDKTAGVVIEVNGQQHQTFSDHFFNSYGDFYQQTYRDDVKRHLCNSLGLKFEEIESHEEINDERIKEIFE